jgi:N-acetylmuramoyl-L-alanine amidase-like protein
MTSSLADTFRLWGIPVKPGTVIPGRPGAFTPTHVMMHHTTGPKGTPAPSRTVVRTGRPDLNGPLCNVLVRRDLSVEIISHGKANHAGEGQWGAIPEDQGNRYAVGVEIEHTGTATEPWLPAYVAFCDRVAAAICDHLGEPAGHVLAHKEYAPLRKIDPFNWQMGDRRAAVAKLLKAGPRPKPAPPAPTPETKPPKEDDDMPTPDQIADAVVAKLLAAKTEVYLDKNADGKRDVQTVAQQIAAGASDPYNALQELRALRADLVAAGVLPGPPKETS